MSFFVKFWKVALIASMGFSAAASAQFVFETEVDAVELAPTNIILPTTISGMMSFRACDRPCDKEYQRIRLSADTRFIMDGRRMKFDEFRRAFSVMRSRETSYALIGYDVETRTATNIEVKP
jgi:hypothetical protein